MPTINASVLFIGDEDWEDKDGSGVATEDDADADADADAEERERARFLGGHAQPTSGGAFWEEDDNKDENDGDK
jgi:hypothetical protein